MTDRNSPIPQQPSTQTTTSTPIGVPLYFDSQRKKRYIVPIRPAPLKDVVVEPRTTSSNQEQNEEEDKNNKIEAKNALQQLLLHKTTTTILVCGLPAIMSIPEMLHLLFYDDIVLENENKNELQQHESTTEKQTPSNFEKGKKSNIEQQNQNPSNFTIDHQPNLFFRFLNSIRVCFGSEKGTLAMLVTFFNDEDDAFSEEKFTFSNAAAEFFSRWHGKSAFSLSKEILTVDFVDMKELRRREELFASANNKQQTEHENEAAIEVDDENDDDEQKTIQNEQNLLSSVSPFWTFLQPAEDEEKEKENQPCAICLEQVSFYLPQQQNNHENTSNGSYNNESNIPHQENNAPSLTTTEDFYTRLSDFSSLLQLPCQHILHTSCFASVAGEAPCPLCRFNCCEEAFAATCSVCQQEQQQSQQQQNRNRNNNNHQQNNTNQNQNDLWICLVCGGCFCSNSNHREEHFSKDSTHHLFIQSGGLRIWDSHFDDYVHRVISNISSSTAETNFNNLAATAESQENDNTWRDHLDWFEDEAEIEANLLHAKMVVMENYYNDLLLEQLQAQEDHFVEKVKREGFIAVCEKFFSKERTARNQIASRWRQELKSNIQGQFFLQMKMRTRQLKGLDAKLKDEIEIQQVVLTTASATKEKYKKFLSVPPPSTNVNEVSSSSPAAASSSNNTKKQPTTSAVAVIKKPTTLQEVTACIDKHPDVVALEKDLEGLINELTSM